MTQPIQPWMQDAGKAAAKEFPKAFSGNIENLKQLPATLTAIIAAHAPADQTQRIAELEGALQRLAHDFKAISYSPSAWDSYKAARALLRKEGSET
jgi:hypothetical protein